MRNNTTTINNPQARFTRLQLSLYGLPMSSDAINAPLEMLEHVAVHERVTFYLYGDDITSLQQCWSDRGNIIAMRTVSLSPH
jgi:hypothetical protein